MQLNSIVMPKFGWGIQFSVESLPIRMRLLSVLGLHFHFYTVEANPRRIINFWRSQSEWRFRSPSVSHDSTEHQSPKFSPKSSTHSGKRTETWQIYCYVLFNIIVRFVVNWSSVCILYFNDYCDRHIFLIINEISHELRDIDMRTF